ncbi:hypothetical protein D3C86_1235760 [compost metagenome]
MPGAADSGADLPRHIAQLASAGACVVPGQDQRLVKCVILFGAAVIGVCKPAYGGGDKTNWRGEGKHTAQG